MSIGFDKIAALLSALFWAMGIVLLKINTINTGFTERSIPPATGRDGSLSRPHGWIACRCLALGHGATRPAVDPYQTHKHEHEGTITMTTMPGQFAPILALVFSALLLKEILPKIAKIAFALSIAGGTIILLS